MRRIKLLSKSRVAPNSKLKSTVLTPESTSNQLSAAARHLDLISRVGDYGQAALGRGNLAAAVLPGSHLVEFASRVLSCLYVLCPRITFHVCSPLFTPLLHCFHPAIQTRDPPSLRLTYAMFRANLDCFHYACPYLTTFVFCNTVPH